MPHTPKRPQPCYFNNNILIRIIIILFGVVLIKELVFDNRLMAYMLPIGILLLLMVAMPLVAMMLRKKG